jgi:NhaA family Na+:H+ antiporter
VLGLVVGKLIGVSGFAWLATRLRIGVLPDGAGWRGILGVAAVAGIGFTVSIFVAGLAFDTIALQYEAKVGILAASVLAAILGSVILLRSAVTPATDAGGVEDAHLVEVTVPHEE